MRWRRHFIVANKTAFANASKFERRPVFVQSEQDSLGIANFSNLSDTGKKMIPLVDSSDIALASVACGKNHVVAVEAPISAERSNDSRGPRIFTWGCGGYGCLGHGVQSDEYLPRMVGTLRGPLFANNVPVRAAAGAQCSMILTSRGHVYYWGKHRPVGEATMRPAMVDALANNAHVVCALGAGTQTVFCATKNGVTVGWGNGPHGELGYGINNPKSSSKPKFVESLDSCLVTDVSCGYGHTLFVVRDDDDEDGRAVKKLRTLEGKDIHGLIRDASAAGLAAQMAKAKNAAASGDRGGEKKGRGRQKKK